MDITPWLASPSKMVTTNSQLRLDGPSTMENCQVSWWVNNEYIPLNHVENRRLGSLQWFIWCPHVSRDHRSRLHVHLQFRSLRTLPHHPNAKRLSIRIRSRANRSTRRPQTGFIRLASPAVNQLYLRESGSTRCWYITHRGRISPLPMWCQQSQKTILCSIRFHYTQRQRIVILTTKTRTIQFIQGPSFAKTLPDRCSEFDYRSWCALYQRHAR